jgi:hypothetical protein
VHDAQRAPAQLMPSQKLARRIVGIVRWEMKGEARADPRPTNTFSASRFNT